MLSKSSILVALTSLASLALADSAEFGLIIIRSGSPYQYSGLVASDNTLVIGSSADEQSATITDAGEFKFKDGSFLTVTDGKITITQDSGSSGFSLSEGGYLSFEGSSAVAINDDTKVAAFGSAASGSTPVAVRAWGTNGQALDAFTPSGVTSTESATTSSSSSSSVNAETPSPDVAVQENGAAALKIGSTGLIAAAALLL